MPTTSRDPPRRRTARTACSLALVLALAQGTTGCAHQLTNAELAAGAVMVGVFVVGPVLAGVYCSECRSSGSYASPPAPELSTGNAHAALPPASGRSSVSVGAPTR
jgi:hypothetical protein